MMEAITENLARVQDQIAAAATPAGRTAGDIELIAVSKTHAAEKVQAAAEAGQALFGESRVQEARARIPLLPARLRWHFIGHLQKNKSATRSRSSSCFTGSTRSRSRKTCNASRMRKARGRECSWR